MPITTIKRCQSEPEWWFTVEDYNVEIDSDSGTGITIKYHDDSISGLLKLSVGKEDALLIRDAINQLYPPEVFKSE